MQQSDDEKAHEFSVKVGTFLGSVPFVLVLGAILYWLIFGRGT